MPPTEREAADGVPDTGRGSGARSPDEGGSRPAEPFEPPPPEPLDGEELLVPHPGPRLACAAQGPAGGTADLSIYYT